MDAKEERVRWECACCGEGWMVKPDMILHCPTCGTIYHGMTIKEFNVNFKVKL